ncbi:hypothetical protein J7L48_03930 [bacterium]|nr:hypothetical protein [bacterium]
MKRITVISLIIAFFVGIFYFAFNISDIYTKNARFTFLQKLSLSYINLPTKSLYYGQKEYTLATFREILANSDFRNELSKKFNNMKITKINYDLNEDAKTFYITIFTKNRKDFDNNAVGNFINEYLSKFFNKLSRTSLEYINEEKKILEEKIKAKRIEITGAFKLNIPEKFANYYKNFKVKYGNAPIPGDVYLPVATLNQANALIYQNLDSKNSLSNFNFDDTFATYIYNMYSFNQMISQLVGLDSIENDMVLLSTSKLSPLTYIGSFKFSLSKKKLLGKTLIIFFVIFIIIFTTLYVFKKD